MIIMWSSNVSQVVKCAFRNYIKFPWEYTRTYKINILIKIMSQQNNENNKCLLYLDDIPIYLSLPYARNVF